MFNSQFNTAFFLGGLTGENINVDESWQRKLSERLLIKYFQPVVNVADKEKSIHLDNIINEIMKKNNVNWVSFLHSSPDPCFQVWTEARNHKHHEFTYVLGSKNGIVLGSPSYL